MSNSSAARPGMGIPPVWTLLGWGVRALFVVFFLGLWLTVVYNAYVDGRVVDAVLGASVFAVPLALVAILLKRHVLD